MAAYADEVQPKSQDLTTPVASVESVPTEVPQAQTTMAPTADPVLTTLPTFQGAPTETFRVIEISTRPPTFAPTQVPSPLPTQAAATAVLISSATPIPDIPPTPIVETVEAAEPTLTPAIYNTVEVVTPVPLLTLTSTFVPSTLVSTSTATSTLTVTSTLTSLPTLVSTPTTDPSWQPPGPECNAASTETGKTIVKLDVPYIQQVNDIKPADGSWACGPTSIAMVLAYYGKIAPWQEYVASQSASKTSMPVLTATPATRTGVSGLAPGSAVTPTSTHTKTAVPTPSSIPTTNTTRKTTWAVANATKTASIKAIATRPRTAGFDFAPYIINAYTNNGYTYGTTARDASGDSRAGLYGTICPTGLAEWGRMQFVLEQHGLTGRYISSTWESVTAALERGRPVLLGNDLTAQGHILVAIGYTDNGNLIVNDPFGNRFIPGYGSTSGEGLFYPWNCSRVRNALEVIGTYPPPPRPVTSDAPAADPSSTDSYFVPLRQYARNLDAYMPEISFQAAIPLPSATPPTVTPTGTPIGIPRAPAKTDKTTFVSATVLVLAATSHLPVEPDGIGGIGWELFSVFGIGVAIVGAGAVKKARRRHDIGIGSAATEMPVQPISSRPELTGEGAAILLVADASESTATINKSKEVEGTAPGESTSISSLPVVVQEERELGPPPGSERAGSARNHAARQGSNHSRQLRYTKIALGVCFALLASRRLRRD